MSASSTQKKSAPTPIMIQYQSIKDEYKDAVLFFRLGDFYEMFNDDAIEVSRLLNLTLTHRGDNPMCGVPYHASKIYIARLLRLGKRVAICEQVTTPAQSKGIVERKVVEVITPGTAIEEDYLERGTDNFLAALWTDAKKTVVSFAYIDVSTGSFSAISWPYAQMSEFLHKEIGKISPRELLICQALNDNKTLLQVLETSPNLTHASYPDWHFNVSLSYKRLCAQFKTVNLRSFSLTEESPELAPAGFLIEYATKNAGAELPHVDSITIYKGDEYLILDDATRKNLEIVQNLRDGSSQFTLLEVLNHTVTPMGSRRLRNWLLSPLTSVSQIQTRQESVLQFVRDRNTLQSLRKALSPILDIERLASRIAMERAHAKDLVALRSSLQAFIEAHVIVSDFSFTGIDIDRLRHITEKLFQSIHDDPSTILTEGRLIKTGWSEHLDHLHTIQENFAQTLESYLEEERAKTGIQNLKVRFNRNDGYFIEVTKGKLDAVPEHFIKKRSLVNAERYTTEKLYELEKELLSAEENIILEERNLFLEIRSSLLSELSFLFEVAAHIAHVDTVACFAHVAMLYNWTCPVVDDSLLFDVVEGRHPVVEMHLPANEFVPNTLLLDEKNFALITGPNMAGKSTFLRQNAIIALLAQIGSFVPATKAHVGLVDRIFCRVGASDNLARGESTFLVEMTETAHILRAATEKSFVIMDEVGRGTSTEDGLSLAWAISEYLLTVIGAKTLFATHYHELTRLIHPKLLLLCMSVLENEGSVVFLKRIKEGASENSYGLHVAQMAGIPFSVVDRAYKILSTIQKNVPTETVQEELPKQVSAPPSNPSLFSEEELVLDELLSCNIDSLTPLEALQILARWKKSLDGTIHS